MRRRELLATTGSAAALSVGAVGTGAAHEVDLEEVDDEFSHVSTEYDGDTLEQFQPLLVMQTEDRKAFRHQLAYVARSDEYSTYACCYIARYQSQQGISGSDSHFRDTEPVYVFVDEGSDVPTEIVMSAWHWNAAGVFDEDAALSADRVESDTHVSLDVINPWHNYQFRDDDRGAFYTLADWHDYRQRLVDNGLYHRGSPAAFEEPWVMSSEGEQRDGWWSEDGVVSSGIPPDVDTDLILMQLYGLLGLRGADTRQEDLR